MKTQLTNAHLAELFCLEAEKAGYPLQRAFKRAGRAAFLWPIEAATLLEQNQSLTELEGIGPFLEKQIHKWFETPPILAPPPEIRRDFLTWSQAQQILAGTPGWKTSLRGDLHMHSEWSDGSAPVRAMAEAALERGYEYIAITDHAKNLKIASGIDEKQLAEQALEIEQLNSEFAQQKKTFRVLRSIELNLSPDGSGDLDATALASLDIVLGAFHSSLRKTDDQTARYCAALSHPQLKVLGHPRGRIFNHRLGLTADWPRVFALAAELDKAVEIDSYPDRQDLNLALLKMARTAGVRISIGTDAHHPWQLAFIDLGLAAALAAKIPQDRILNFLPREELIAWAAK